ncbi:MAG: hypothetical protein QOH79_2463 [Acidimicrobiaceae bacterium]|jgi:hypothetical protein
MRIRQILTRLTVLAGLAAAFGGYLAAWQTGDLFVGSVWMVMGVGLMAGGAIYSMAMDDPEAREKALTTHRRRTTDTDGPVVDLRDRETIRTARERAATSHRVGV